MMTMMWCFHRKEGNLGLGYIGNLPGLDWSLRLTVLALTIRNRIEALEDQHSHISYLFFTCLHMQIVLLFMYLIYYCHTCRMFLLSHKKTTLSLILVSPCQLGPHVASPLICKLNLFISPSVHRSSRKTGKKRKPWWVPVHYTQIS